MSVSGNVLEKIREGRSEKNFILFFRFILKWCKCTNEVLIYLLYTVKHFLFTRTLYSREFGRPVTRENKVQANISHVSIIVQEMNNRENKVS